MISNEDVTVLVVVLDALGRDTIQRYISAPSVVGSRTYQSVQFPNLESLGLGNILSPEHHSRIAPAAQVDVALAAEPASFWSDSVMGHRELSGFIDHTQYTLFYEGFPSDYVRALEARVHEAVGVHRPVLYNQRAGGMEAIEQNHDEHMRTGGIIVYSSMCDPLIQIAACEEKIAPDELTRIAQIAFDLAREMGVNITRSITRPYVVDGGTFVRTKNRRDIVIAMPHGVETLIDIARDHNVITESIGKCYDVVNTPWDMSYPLASALPPELESLYAHPKHSDKNPYSVEAAQRALTQSSTGGRHFIMCNLPDTDSLYGHVRDVPGACMSMKAFDTALPRLIAALPKKGFLIVTADHGMEDRGDYGYHGREPVPVLGIAKDGRISDRIHVPQSASTYAVVGYLAAQLFGFGKEYVERCRLQEFFR